MSASKEISTLRDTVKQLLEEYPKYRDSDKKLCCRIWQMELAPRRNVKTLTTFDFFDIYCNQSILSSGESITRATRMIKEEFPELEGKKAKRLEEVPKVQEVVRIN